MDSLSLVSAIILVVALTFLAAPRVLKLRPLYRQPRIFRLFPGAVVGIAPSGAIRTLNPAAEQLFGRAQFEMRGLPLSSIIRGASAPGPANNIAVPSPAGIETEAILPGGSTFPVRCLALGHSYLLVSELSPRPLLAMPSRGQFRRCEDLLTEVNGRSELLLADMPSNHPLRLEIEQLHDASAKAIAAFQEACPAPRARSASAGS